MCVGSREDYYINHIIQYDLFKGSSLTHSLTYSLTHLLTYLLTYSLTHSLTTFSIAGIMKLLSEAPQRDNVITAAISDLFVFIEKESVKALISYLVEKYSSIFTIPTQDSAQGVVSQPGSKEGEGLASVSRWVQLFQNLKLKYDQIHDTSQGSNRLLTHSYLLTHSLTHSLTYLYLLTHSVATQ